ncbi:Wadjet anti-phage system protein JetA family protein [Sphingomonas colocasiae]|uniref:DUF5716 family protein n=1 Tax=Sphingomonas colocasiae TaxID=1848973 RepID=A0ABS7PIF9_9SPHN|nr:Wadjet anti-phage system protein JetA family protein [Sphingomonas colocasiae]MBY8821090.1 DUF5716 family protein [Sphingomonas colocasiae]
MGDFVAVPTEKPLFGTVPGGLFRLFAGSSRYFFADLLTHLADDAFGVAGEIVTRKRLYVSISEFIDRIGRASAVEALTGEASGSSQSYINAYNRLVETGWLIEYRDRYRKVVDFDPAARLLLHTLLDIQSGRVRSYGGAVLNVLTLLQSVAAEPKAKALNVREAALAARGFMNHLRTVAGTMRRVEGLIMAQPTAAALVRRFVRDFIEASVVQDYRNLHTRESPYRFRGEIIELGETLLADEDVLTLVAEGWVKGGIARKAGPAREDIINDLRDVIRVFSAIDDHVRDIETTTFRIERRMTNVVRFSDRMATISTERILTALEFLGKSTLNDEDKVEARTRLQHETLPMAPQQLYLPPKRRREPIEREVEVRPPDPALAFYLRAIDLFQRRVGVTPERLAIYVEEAMGEADELAANDFPVRNLDDFLAFERLHESGLFPLNDRFEYEERAGTVTNDWIERRNFVVRRKAVEAANG